MQYVLDAFKLKCMSGIRTSLETGDDIVTWREYIDHLTFSFVAPLKTKQYVSFHVVRNKIVLYQRPRTRSVTLESIVVECTCSHVLAVDNRENVVELSNHEQGFDFLRNGADHCFATGLARLR